MTSTSYVDHAKYTKVNGQYIKWAAWVLEYKQYSYPDELEEVSSKILSHLELKFCPPKYRKLNMENPLFGHCYHVTQAMYFFFKDVDLKVMSAKCQGPAEQHWWLEDGDKIIDITAGQYDAFDFDPPYYNGRITNWYGWRNRPHRKTQDLMKLVQPSAKLEWKQYAEKPKKSY